MRRFVLVFALIGCSSDGPEITPDPTGGTAGVGGSPSAAASGGGGESSSVASGGAPSTSSVGGSGATTAAAGGGGAGGAPGGAGGAGGATSGAGGAGGEATTGAGAGGPVAGSRLKPRYYVGADGSRQFRDWFDTELGVGCAFQKAIDGKSRCVPEVVATLQLFADAACTIPAMIDPGTQCGGGTVAGHYAGRGESLAGNCSGVAYYKLGDRPELGPLYQGGSCLLNSDSASRYVGTPVAPATFVEATTETAP